MSIQVSYEEIPYRLKNKNKVLKWIISSTKSENYRIGQVSISFVSKSKVKAINKQFLKHNYFTDIITFDYSGAKLLEGELIICPEVVKTNARDYGSTFSEEMLRVIVHGFLHMMKYDDKSNRKRKVMRSKEDFYISKFK